MEKDASMGTQKEHIFKVCIEQRRAEGILLDERLEGVWGNDVVGIYIGNQGCEDVACSDMPERFGEDDHEGRNWRRWISRATPIKGLNGLVWHYQTVLGEQGRWITATSEAKLMVGQDVIVF